METVSFRNVHDLPGISIGHIARTLAYLRSIMRSIGRMLLRRLKRNRTEVSSEYDQGHWARVLNEKNWLQNKSLADFLIGNNQQMTLARINDTLRRVRVSDYYNYRLIALPELLSKYLNFSNEDSVVELGCGVGFNLFALALAFPKLRLIGVDYSTNAIAAGREIAAHFNLSNRIRFETLDLTDPQHPGFSLIEGKNCFTFFCIEQIPYEVSAVIKNIVAANPKRVVHVEPTTERLSMSRIGDWANLLYIKSVDYQTQLFSVLTTLDQLKQIQVLEEARAPFSPTVQNDGFIISWTPKTSDSHI